MPAGKIKWRILARETAGRDLARIVIAVLAVQALLFKAGADFQVFRRASLRLLHGEPLYRLDDDIPFTYLPVAPWLLLWSVLPEQLAHAFWVIAGAAALAVFFDRCAREAHLEGSWGACLLALALIFPFAAQELALGQINALLLLAMSQSESMRLKRPALSGLLWALVCVVKPPFLIFALPALGWREWRRLQFLFLGIALLFALGALYFGQSYPSQWVAWREFIAVVVPPALCAPDNQSLFAIFCTYLIRPDAKFFTAAVAACAFALTGLAIVAVRRLRAVDEHQARFLAISLSFYATALLSPNGWQTNLIALLPLVFFLIAQTRRTTSGVGALPAFVALGLLAAADLLNFETLGRVAFQRVLIHRHYGIAALLAAALACITAARTAAVKRA